MQTSIFLARLLGPLLLPGVGLLVNPAGFRAMAREVVTSITLVYLFGLVDFAAGLAIVLTHNVWVANWRVLITLLAWVLLIRGFCRVMVPRVMMRFAENIFHGNAVYTVSGTVLTLLGLVLCGFGYTA
jgi:hypothetical protein